MSANDKQVGGDHYKSTVIQPWDYIVANKLDFFSGNVIKYVTRFAEKGGVTDLKKAQHYLEKLIELQETKTWEDVYLDNQISPIPDPKT